MRGTLTVKRWKEALYIDHFGIHSIAAAKVIQEVCLAIVNPLMHNVPKWSDTFKILQQDKVKCTYFYVSLKSVIYSFEKFLCPKNTHIFYIVLSIIPFIVLGCFRRNLPLNSRKASIHHFICPCKLLFLLPLLFFFFGRTYSKQMDLRMRIIVNVSEIPSSCKRVPTSPRCIFL